MSKNKISLNFYGRDFTLIKKDLKDEIEFVEGRNLNKEEQLKIIIKFLDYQEKNLETLVVDSNKKKNKCDKIKLYKKDDKEYFWDGFVGIIKGNLPSIRESELKDIFVGEDVVYTNLEITIQIQSRLDVDEDGNRAKPYFLTTMLLQCKTNVTDQLVPNNSEEFFFDLLLLYLFKEKANECFVKGLYKTYQRFEKNDDHLKGTIDISRHIRLNMGLDNGKIAYSYRENTVDNYLNHLILYAFEKLKRKYPDAVRTVYTDSANVNFKFFIDTLKSKININNYDSRVLISKNLVSISHPFYTEYEELRKISLRILRDEGLTMFDGNEEDVNGILFYIPTLWELYLEHIIYDKNYTLYTQGYKNESVKIINYVNEPNEFKQPTYPDYVLSCYIKGNEIPFMILDAKFKPKWAQTILKGTKFTSDELDDYDKCIRDMNSVNAHACGTIFPTNINLVSNLDNALEHNISNFNNIDKFYTFPIIIPYSNVGYNKWISDLKTKNVETIKKMKEYILTEKDFMINNYDELVKMNNLRK